MRRRAEECDRYNAKKHDHIPKLREVVQGLEKLRLKPEKVVIISLDSCSGLPKTESWDADWVRWDDFLASGGSAEEIPFYRGSFDHPLWILFSSGTTGQRPS